MESVISNLTIIGALILLIMISLTSCAVDSIASALVWEDANCNGQADQGEVPLEGVCVWYGHSPDSLGLSPICSGPMAGPRTGLTDHSGKWGSGLIAGWSCEGIYIFIDVPNGYEPTTDTVVNGCQAAFGLAPISICPER